MSARGGEDPRRGPALGTASRRFPGSNLRRRRPGPQLRVGTSTPSRMAHRGRNRQPAGASGRSHGHGGIHRRAVEPQASIVRWLRARAGSVSSRPALALLGAIDAGNSFGWSWTLAMRRGGVPGNRRFPCDPSPLLALSGPGPELPDPAAGLHDQDRGGRVGVHLLRRGADDELGDARVALVPEHHQVGPHFLDEADQDVGGMADPDLVLHRGAMPPGNPSRALAYLGEVAVFL